MRLFKCDVCGKEVEFADIHDLRRTYAPEGVNDICSRCRGDIAAIVRETRHEYEELMMQAIRAKVDMLRKGGIPDADKD